MKYWQASLQYDFEGESQGITWANWRKRREQDISVTMPLFNVISRRSSPEIVLSRKNLFFLQISASKVANWIIVDIIKYPCYHWQTLATHIYFYFFR